MSTKNELLQSSIADAKLIKEAAMLNAKKAIEEAFAPHLKEMLSSKIQEMEDEQLNEAEGDDLRGILKDLGTESEIEAYIEKVKSDRESYHGWYQDDMIEDFKYWLQDKEDSALEEGKVEEEFDLDELLKEISDEEIPTNPTDPNDNLVCEDEDKEDTEDDKNEDTEDTDEDDEELDLDNMSEDDLRGFIENVIQDMVEAGELEADEETEGLKDEEDIDLGLDDLEDDEDELTEIKSQLQESINKVEKLEKRLNEVNLLNSKLLYVNKLYKSTNLTESKKNTILESFDKVNTVKEAKITYDLLKENLINSSNKPNTQIIKGLASKPSMVIKENKSTSPILEQDSLYKRMQKLAGL